MQIDLLDLVHTVMGEGDDARLAVGGFAQEVTSTLAHDEGTRTTARGAARGVRRAGDLKGCAGEGRCGGGNHQR